MKGTDVILVHSDHEETALELLSAAAPLAAAAGARVTAVVQGNGAEARALDRIARGADEALTFAEGDGAVSCDLAVAALAAAVEDLRPLAVLAGATTAGTEIAARLAQRLGVGCGGDATSLSFVDGKLESERATLGRFVCRQAIDANPAIVTVQPRRYHVPDPVEGRSGPVRSIRFEAPVERVRVTGTRVRAASDVRLDKAEVVVAVGRGLRKPEDLAIVQDLARALGGAVGASRPLTDDLRWLPTEHKVGLSGVTVRPRLYVACGISGQIEHSVGMREAGVVVAINTNPAAPIMDQADFRVTADLYEILPELTRALRELD